MSVTEKTSLPNNSVYSHSNLPIPYQYFRTCFLCTGCSSVTSPYYMLVNGCINRYLWWRCSKQKFLHQLEKLSEVLWPVPKHNALTQLISDEGISYIFD